MSCTCRARPAPAARAALALFTLSLIAYLFCQRSRTARSSCHGRWPWSCWLCASAAPHGCGSPHAACSTIISRSRRRWSALPRDGRARPGGQLAALGSGLAGCPIPEATALEHVHALAMLGFTARGALGGGARLARRSGGAAARRCAAGWRWASACMPRVALIVELAVRGARRRAAAGVARDGHRQRSRWPWRCWSRGVRSDSILGLPADARHADAERDRPAASPRPSRAPTRLAGARRAAPAR